MLREASAALARTAAHPVLSVERLLATERVAAALEARRMKRAARIDRLSLDSLAGATVERARDFVKDCHDLGLIIHADFILGLPGETKESIWNTINFAKQLDCETIQVSVAHAYPGTEFYDYAKRNDFITNENMEDGGGHQMAHIEYPGLPTEYVMEMVHKFYDEYYFRPKAAFRVVWKAIVNRDVPRLYVEAKSFMKLRAQRNKAARAKKEENALKQQESVSMNA